MMDNLFLQELLTADESEKKAALVAEYLFNRLPNETALIARRCSILHWFDLSIVEALLKDIPSNKSQPRKVYEQIRSLPFVEALPWGLAYNNLTRDALLHHYSVAQPELLRTAARLAAPAYGVHGDDTKIVAEAFFCYLIAGETTLASEILKGLEQRAKKQGDQEYIDGLQSFVQEVQKFSLEVHADTRDKTSEPKSPKLDVEYTEEQTVEDPISISMTSVAADKVRELLEQENDPSLGLRIFVIGGGSGGLQYGMTLDEEQEKDIIIVMDGFKVLIDNESQRYLTSVKVNYVDGLMGSGFTIENLNEVANVPNEVANVPQASDHS